MPVIFRGCRKKETTREFAKDLASMSKKTVVLRIGLPSILTPFLYLSRITMKSSGQTRDDGHFCVTKNFPTPTNIVERVYRRQIALERLFVRASAVYGTIRVDNWTFHKRVFVKSTTDGWKTTSTIDAYHSMYHPKTNTDSFQFKLTLASRDSVVVTFALCLAANGREYWDNNESRDYRLELSER